MEYRNSHTISTKCQYHAAHSNPIVWSLELSFFEFCSRFVKRNKEPRITWRPWNPVAMKNTDPKVESDMQNGASMYSTPWNKEKTMPRKIVVSKEYILLLSFFLKIWWCAHVTDTPDDRRRIVFRSGILIGLNELIVSGGHMAPTSIVGVILLWKNAQKNDTKNKTSDEINKIIPYFNPVVTNLVWYPSSLDSR